MQLYDTLHHNLNVIYGELTVLETNDLHIHAAIYSAHSSINYFEVFLDSIPFECKSCNLYKPVPHSLPDILDIIKSTITLVIDHMDISHKYKWSHNYILGSIIKYLMDVRINLQIYIINFDKSV